MEYITRGVKVSRSSVVFALRRGDPIIIKNGTKVVHIKTSREDENDLVYIVRHGGLQEKYESWLEAMNKAEELVK